MDTSPSGVRYVGPPSPSSPIAYAMEQILDSLPRNKRAGAAQIVEGGIIELSLAKYPMEKRLYINTAVSGSRAGVLIRGQSERATQFYAPAGSDPNNFKDEFGNWNMLDFRSPGMYSGLLGLQFHQLNLMCDFTPTGTITGRMTEKAILFKAFNCGNLAIEHLCIDAQTFSPYALDQLCFEIKECYYSNIRHFILKSVKSQKTGVGYTGKPADQCCGVAGRFINNNGIQVQGMVATGFHRGVEMIHENGSTIWGGCMENVNQPFFFADGSSDNNVEHMRLEFHMMDGTDEMTDALVAQFAETTRDNVIKVNRVLTPDVKLMDDRSIRGGNQVITPSAPKVVSGRNMLAGATWRATEVGVSTELSDDVPLCGEFGYSTKVKTDGGYNRAYYAEVKVDPELTGQVTLSWWMKRLSPYGMATALVKSSIVTSYPNGGGVMTEPVTGRWNVPIPVESFSFDGVYLTVKTKVDHKLQPAMRVEHDGLGGWPIDAELYVDKILGKRLVRFAAFSALTSKEFAVTPLNTTPGNLLLSSDMQAWRGNADVSTWQQFVGIVPIRGCVIGMSLNAAGNPVLQMDAPNYMGNGGQIKLFGLDDARLNRVITIKREDINGDKVTLSGLVIPDLSMKPVGLDTARPYYGYGGSTSLMVSFTMVTMLRYAQTQTLKDQLFEFLVAGAVLQGGNKQLMIT